MHTLPSAFTDLFAILNGPLFWGLSLFLGLIGLALLVVTQDIKHALTASIPLQLWFLKGILLALFEEPGAVAAKAKPVPPVAPHEPLLTSADLKGAGEVLLWVLLVIAVTGLMAYAWSKFQQKKRNRASLQTQLAQAELIKKAVGSQLSELEDEILLASTETVVDTSHLSALKAYKKKLINLLAVKSGPSDMTSLMREVADYLESKGLKRKLLQD